MRLALISDVHGNIAALEVVLADARAAGAREYVFLGDYIFDMPFGEKVIRRLRSMRNAHFISGNREGYFERLDEADEARANSQQYGVVYQTWRELSADSKEFIRRLPKTLSLLLPSGRTLYAVHALNLSRADKNRFTSAGAFQRAMLEAPFTHAEYLKDYRAFLEGEAREAISALPGDLIAFGHNHLQSYGQSRGKWLVNPGSVSQPLDFNPGASYTLVDDLPGGFAVTERRARYDRAAAVREAKRTECYRRGKCWMELVFREVQNGVDALPPFFECARRMCAETGAPGDPIPDAIMERALRESMKKYQRCLEIADRMCDNIGG